MIYNDFNIKMYIFLSLEVIRGSQIMETAPRCCSTVTVAATACLVNLVHAVLRADMKAMFDDVQEQLLQFSL